jgi:hypothetical protein
MWGSLFRLRIRFLSDPAGGRPAAATYGPREMADDDLGFICKGCHRFPTDSEVKEWNTKWESRNGEDWLTEIIRRCPLCGETVSYQPNESLFRFQAENGS